MDLSDRSESERKKKPDGLPERKPDGPLISRRGRCFEVTLLRLGEDDHVLLLTMHHIVSDGWSMGVLYRELSVLYRAFTSGEPSPLAELPIQYADYAVWQREWLQGRSIGESAFLLEEAAGGNSCGTESSHGSSTASRSELPRSATIDRAIQRTNRGAQSLKPKRRRDACS